MGERNRMARPFRASKAVSVTAQEALVRGALSGADVLLWLRVRAMPVIGWVCVKCPRSGARAPAAHASDGLCRRCRLANPLRNA